MLMGLASEARWQLYRVLADPARLRVLALAAEEELSIGELGELTGESQPNLSRHAAPLRQAGLLSERRQGARTLLRLAPGKAEDPVVADALAAGRLLCDREGRRLRIAEVVRARDARSREYFAGEPPEGEPLRVASELPAYLFALSLAAAPRRLALDAGTGDGALLDVLAPSFERVVALDRSLAQLARAERRVTARGYQNVRLLGAELGDASVRDAVGAGADVVMAARVLHHAPLPRATVAELAALLAPGGALVLLDYQRHRDEHLREQHADVWLGFDRDELLGWVCEAGLVEPLHQRVPGGYVGRGFDHHLGWQAVVARRPPSP